MTTACQLADSYNGAIAALWRGDGARLAHLQEWLQAFWSETNSEPAVPPAAVSPHAAGGRGLRWFETPTAVLGRIPDHPGGYVVPREAELPRMTDHADDGGRAIPRRPVGARPDRGRCRAEDLAGGCGCWAMTEAPRS